jgi:hypothetical protein
VLQASRWTSLLTSYDLLLVLPHALAAQPPPARACRKRRAPLKHGMRVFEE